MNFQIELLIKAPFSKEDKAVVTLNTSTIQEHLPHRGRWQLVQEACVLENGIVGELNISQEMCEGHSPGGNNVLAGACLCDMAAQLLGIWCAISAYVERLKNLDCMARRYDGVKFSCLLFPGDFVEMGLDYKNIEVAERRGGIFIVSGKDFSVTSGNRRVATIGCAELVFFSKHG